MHLGGGLKKTLGMHSRSKESYARTPHLIRLKISRVFSQEPGAPEGTLGLLCSGLLYLLPAHALLMSHQDATSPQEPAEELLSTALLALLNLSPLGSWRRAKGTGQASCLSDSGRNWFCLVVGAGETD